VELIEFPKLSVEFRQAIGRMSVEIRPALTTTTKAERMKSIRSWALGDNMGLLIHRKLVSQIKNWRWCAFAIFLTLFCVICFILGIIYNTYYTLLERLHFSVDILSLLALWGLGLQKRILSRLFWRILFFIHALLCVLCLIYGTKYDLPLMWCVIIHVADAMILIPYWIGLFIYAFRSKHIWGEAGHRPKAVSMVYSQYKWVRRKRWLEFLKFPAIVALIILCLTFIPMIIRNNRVCYPEGCPPQFNEHMFRYRRTTIPQLQEYERLFPKYLFVFDFNDSEIVLDANGTGDYIVEHDPNSLVRWRLSAGLHKRYLVVMETDIIFAEIDPETEEIISPGSHDEPVFSLWEVDSISIYPQLVLFGERHAWAEREKVKTFNNDEWKELVKADGDFSVLGIELKKDDPIPDFELAFWNNQ
jgi:hypothetical protein